MIIKMIIMIMIYMTSFIVSIIICSIFGINAAIIALYITAKMIKDNEYYNRIIGMSLISFSTVFFVSFLIVFPVIHSGNTTISIHLRS